jgi:hypothetical protein
MNWDSYRTHGFICYVVVLIKSDVVYFGLEEDHYPSLG